MDRGLNNLLDNIGLSIKSTIATISMGGDSPDVKLNKAIESYNTKKIKSILKSNTIARKVTDLISENLRQGDSKTQKSLKVTQTLIECASFLERDKHFQKGSTIIEAIAKNHPEHGKLIDNHFKKGKEISENLI